MSCQQISDLVDEKQGIEILLSCDNISRRVYLISIQVFVDMVLGRDDESVRVHNFEWKEIDEYEPVENEALDKKSRKLLKSSSKALTKADARDSLGDSMTVRKSKTKEHKHDSSED